MATAYELLLQARISLLTQIAAHEAAAKPDYSLEGQSFQWQQMLNSMYDRLAKLNEQIQNLEPFEFQTEGR